MRRRHSERNELALILGLLVLAFLGKGPLATGTSRGTMPDMTSGDPTMPKGSKSTGENEQPSETTNGVNTRSSPGSDTQNFPGGTGGVVDKSKNNSPPMGPVVTPDMRMPSTVNLISPTPPSGGMILPTGQVYVPGLDMYGNSTKGPGSGPYDPSITTVYGNTTYTNANLTQLAKEIDAKNQELFNYYSGKEVAHPMAISMFAAAPAMKNGAEMPATPLDVPTRNPAAAMMPMMETKPVMQTLNVMDPNVLSRLLQGGYGFGQNVLNQFLQGGQDLFNLIGKNPLGVLVPGVPGAPVITPQILG